MSVIIESVAYFNCSLLSNWECIEKLSLDPLDHRATVK